MLKVWRSIPEENEMQLESFKAPKRQIGSLTLSLKRLLRKAVWQSLLLAMSKRDLAFICKFCQGQAWEI